MVARVLAILLLLFSTGCASTAVRPQPQMAELMATVVRIDITTPKESWTGSGVVYGQDAAGNSLVLTAHHILERASGIAVTITAHNTTTGRMCLLKPKTLGVTDHRDTATATASCNLGPQATLGSSAPAPGAPVTVIGHPLGMKLPVVTQGTVSGQDDEGYTVISAAAFGGNSGGPAFNQEGEVIGLLVRANPDYAAISWLAPLREVLARVEAK